MSYNNPRRTTKSTSTALTPTSSASGLCPTVNTNMSLRKGATFHSPHTPECELPHHFKVPALPRRSQTTLEDVVDAYKRRAFMKLGDIDRGLSAVEDQSSSTRQTFPDEADPVPRGFLDHTVGTSPATKSYGPIMAPVMSEEQASIGRRSLRPRHNRRASRYSDSALGSSIGSSFGKKAADTALTSVTEDVKPSASAITRSAAHSSTIESLPRLSARASNRIQEHILRPLLSKASLKDFHPIVKDCPRRIHSKEIVCLRDLEKTLIFMAPERTKTAALYLEFCLTSIRCIQATVEFLSEREQTRPHDRPYTNGYFVDLVDQIKQYAQQVQAAKEKEENGEKLGEMDPEAGDEIRLHGGLTKNGRPAELVRVKKNGKAISVATGLPVELDEESKDAMRFKRSLSEEEDEEEAILRSMARRKRSASAAELAPKRCREPGCDKEFKRPCDLTKHEKTHSRPWKCPDESCKYHEYGWPTEKEMDRHVNDKHSSAPALYECNFKPCPYRSKRESNCKQHMEKAHGWVYVRSKNNGKNRDKATASTPANGLPTPQTTNAQTPSSMGEANTMPLTPEEDDMNMSGYEGSMFDNAQSNINFPTYPPNLDLFTSDQLQLEYSPITDPLSGSSVDHSPYMGNAIASDEHFADNFHNANFSTTGGVDFNLYEETEDIYSAPVQLPTPNHDMFLNFETSGMPLPLQFQQTNPTPHISPIGHGNAMLYTPKSMHEQFDEGFEDFIPHNNDAMGANDFQLYPSGTGGSGATIGSGSCSTANTGLFGELPRAGGIDFGAISNQELLNYFDDVTAAAAAAALANGNGSTGMDWEQDQFNGYGSH